MKKILLINLICLSLFACTNNNDERIRNLSAPKEAVKEYKVDQNNNNYDEFYKEYGCSMHYEMPLKEVIIYPIDKDFNRIDRISMTTRNQHEPYSAEYIEVHEKFEGGCSSEEEFMKFNSFLYQDLKREGYVFVKIISTSWFSSTMCYYAMHYENRDGIIPKIRF